MKTFNYIASVVLLIIGLYYSEIFFRTVINRPIDVEYVAVEGFKAAIALLFSILALKEAIDPLND